MVKYRNYYNSKVKTCADLIQKSVDNIILAAAFALLCLSTYYLYFRPFPRNNKLNLPSIAKLSHAQNTVKYRGYDNFSWENAKGGLPLVQGDSIYTHESSGAKIDFDSGPSLSMDPYTLLKISQKDKEFALNLLSGNISAQLNKEDDHITLLLGTRKFRLSGTKAQIKIKKQGNKAQISVLKGQVKISEGQNQDKEFGVSELELTSETGIPKNAFNFEIEFEKIPPDFIKSFPKEEIYFSFNSPPGNQKIPFKIQVENISTGKIDSFLVKENQVNLKSLKPGFHAIQVTKVTSEGKLKSPLMNFTLEHYEPPYFSIPTSKVFVESDQVIPISIDEQEYFQTLSLLREDRTIKEIEIEPVLKANDVQTLNFQYDFVKSGDYTFQLKPKGIDDPRFIKSTVLTVAQKEALRPPLPFATNKNDVYFQTKDFQKVALKWERVYEDSTFEIEINGQIFKTTNPFYNYSLKKKENQSDILEWKVREIVNNRKTPFSSPLKLKIQPVENFLLKPAAGTKIVLEKPNQLVTFQWQGKLKSNESFEFQVSKTPDFMNPLINKRTKERLTKTALGAKGEYYWRVKIKTKSGKIRFGSPVKIQIEPAPPPSPIKLKEKIELKIQRRSVFNPLNKSLSLSILNSFFAAIYAANESFTKFTWPSNPLAKAYIFRVYDKLNPENPLLEAEVTESQYIWNNPKPGTYYWEVAIKDYWDRVGDFSNRSTVVLKGDPLPIKLIQPKHNFKIPYQQTKEIQFKFDTISAGEILFSPSLNFKNPILRKTVKGSQISISPVELRKTDRKELYWQVIAGERKSLRRKVLLTSPPKRSPRLEISPLLAKKVLPVWKNRLYQKISSVSADQTAPLFNAEATGVFVNLIGFQKLFTPMKRNAYQIEAEFGKGVAFDSLDYFQSRVSLTRHSRNKEELQNLWSYSFGLEAQYQTSFGENSSNRLEAVQNGLFGGVIGIRTPFHFLKPHEATLEFIYGNYFSYRAGLRTFWGQFKKYPLSTQLFMESLKYEDGNSELSRTSLGLAWEFSF